MQQMSFNRTGEGIEIEDWFTLSSKSSRTLIVPEGIEIEADPDGHSAAMDFNRTRRN